MLRVGHAFLASKALVLCVAALCAWRFDAYMPDVEVLMEAYPVRSRLDGALRLLLAHLARWDGAYFLSIALRGYTHEQHTAFFPLVPLLMRWFARADEHVLGRWLSPPVLCLIAGVLLSFLGHWVLVCNVQRLTRLLTGDARFAHLCALAAAFSPAAPFMAAPYSEGVFGALATTGMALWHARLRVPAAFVFALACVARANGTLLAGFFVFDALRAPGILSAALSLALAALSASGYVAVQAFHAHRLCASARPWCLARLPHVYPYVQERYWNVGLLRYWRPWQVAMFVLALPAAWVTARFVTAFVRRHGVRRTAAMAVGPHIAFISPFCRIFGDASTTTEHGKEADADSGSKSGVLANTAILPHIVMQAVLLLSAGLYAHIQILPRLFSFQPAFYWAIAHAYVTGGSRLRTAVVLYLLAQSTVFVVLFCVQLPPA